MSHRLLKAAVGGTGTGGRPRSVPPAAPAVQVAPYCSVQAYYFRVGANCNFDNGANLCDDAVDPAPGTCRGGCADFNHIDGVTVADIFAFLTAWFQGNQACH